MKTYRKELWFEIPTRRGFVNITPKVEDAVGHSGVSDGLCLVNAMHITASVFINDDESGLHDDYEKWLQEQETFAALYPEAAAGSKLTATQEQLRETTVLSVKESGSTTAIR